MPIMNENTAKLMAIIDKHNGDAIDIREPIANCTLDIICGMKTCMQIFLISV